MYFFCLFSLFFLFDSALVANKAIYIVLCVTYAEHINMMYFTKTEIVELFWIAKSILHVFTFIAIFLTIFLNWGCQLTQTVICMMAVKWLLLLLFNFYIFTSIADLLTLRSLFKTCRLLQQYFCSLVTLTILESNNARSRMSLYFGMKVTVIKQCFATANEKATVVEANP